MLTISEGEIFHRLEFDNPWWTSGVGIDRQISEFKRRTYFAPLIRLIEERSVNRAVVVMGPRRVGKTVMVFHAIQALLDSGIPGNCILYASLETPLYSGLPLEKIVGMFQSRLGHKRDAELYVFFDEVQYLRDWERHLKSLVDSFASCRFVVTGSAAAALRLKSRESGAGRFTEFILPPLTFSEYVDFIGRKDALVDPSGETTPDIEELNREFCHYLNYGGYPEAVLSGTVRNNLDRYIKSDIIDKVLLRDLPGLYGIGDIQELNRLFTTLAYNTGMELSLEGLSKTSGVAKNTIRRYLEYLEAAFLIRRVDRIDLNARHFRRATSFKVYLTNPSMRSALFGPLDSDDSAMGHLVETAIYSQWLHDPGIDQLYFSRWAGGEVDIVHVDTMTQKPTWIVEVKWSDRACEDRKELNNCVEFSLHNKIDKIRVLVTTKNMTQNVTYKNITFDFLPSSLYAYIVGEKGRKLRGESF